MIKIATTKGEVIYLSKTTIKEIVVKENENCALIRTENTVYEISASDVEDIVHRMHCPTGELASAIRSLTVLLRARLH